MPALGMFLCFKKLNLALARFQEIILRPVSVAQKNKPSTMLSSSVQSIDLPVYCMAWLFWTMRESNGCSTPAPRSSAAKQWFEQVKRRRME